MRVVRLSLVVTAALTAAVLGLSFFAIVAAQPRVQLVQPGSFTSAPTFLKFSSNGTVGHLTRAARDGDILLNMRSVDNGTYQPFEGRASSAPFAAPPFLSVPLRGPVYEVQPYAGHFDRMDASIAVECITTGRRIELLDAVNLDLYERVVPIDADFCDGRVRIVAAASANVEIAVGTPATSTVLSYLSQGPLGYLAGLMLAVGTLSLITLPCLAIRADLTGKAIAFAYPSALGYLIYYLAYAAVPAPTLGVLALTAVFAPLAVALALRRTRLDSAIWANWSIGMVLPSITMLTVVTVLPRVAGAWLPNGVFDPVGWSTDNHLPTMMALDLIANGPGHPAALGPWSITDRGFAPAGLMIGLIGALQTGDLYERIASSFVVTHTFQFVIQSSVVSLLLMLGNAGGATRRGWLLCALLVSSPFILFNTFYVWPKLTAGALTLLGFTLFIDFANTRSRAALLVAPLCLALAMCTHAASLLAMPFLAIATIWLVWGTGGLQQLVRRGLPWLVIGSVLAIGVVALHDGLEPKSSYGTTLLLTGTPVFGLHRDQIIQATIDYWRNLTWDSFVAGRLLALEFLLHPPSGTWYALACSNVGVLDCVRVTQFYSAAPALGISIVLLCLSPRPRVSRTTTTIGIWSAAGIVILVIAAATITPTHQLPYALFLALLLLAIERARQLPTIIAVGLLGLQVTISATVWLLGPFLHWQSQLG